MHEEAMACDAMEGCEAILRAIDQRKKKLVGEGWTARQSSEALFQDTTAGARHASHGLPYHT